MAIFVLYHKVLGDKVNLYAEISPNIDFFVRETFAERFVNREITLDDFFT